MLHADRHEHQLGGEQRGRPGEAHQLEEEERPVPHSAVQPVEPQGNQQPRKECGARALTQGELPDQGNHNQAERCKREEQSPARPPQVPGGQIFRRVNNRLLR